MKRGLTIRVRIVYLGFREIQTYREIIRTVMVSRTTRRRSVDSANYV